MRYRFLRFPEGKYKAVTLSYDDGCRPDIKMSQIISRYGLKCTYNINSGWYGKDSNDWHLTRNEIKEHLLDKGHEIAVHGEFHKAPGIVRAIDGIRDVLNCRLALEKDFGIIVRGMAYPDCGITRMDNGTTYVKVKNYLTELDIPIREPWAEITIVSICQKIGMHGCQRCIIIIQMHWLGRRNLSGLLAPSTTPLIVRSLCICGDTAMSLTAITGGICSKSFAKRSAARMISGMPPTERYTIMWRRTTHLSTVQTACVSTIPPL